ncbi:MAG: hypothetical protein ACE5HI_07375 [bacterium]
MLTKNDINWKRAIVSIIVAALSAFVTTLLQGLLDFVKSLDSTTTSGVVGFLVYFIKNKS